MLGQDAGSGGEEEDEDEMAVVAEGVSVAGERHLCGGTRSSGC